MTAEWQQVEHLFLSLPADIEKIVQRYCGNVAEISFKMVIDQDDSCADKAFCECARIYVRRCHQLQEAYGRTG